MRPVQIVAFVVVAFATLVTVHVLASLSLAVNRSRTRGFAALVIPPIFPYFAIRYRTMGWLAVWCGALVIYAVALTVALTWR